MKFSCSLPLFVLSTSFSRFTRSLALHLNTLSSSEYILPDSFVNKGPNDANIKTYKAENGLIAPLSHPQFQYSRR